jgi:hypothetical protein
MIPKARAISVLVCIPLAISFSHVMAGLVPDSTSSALAPDSTVSRGQSFRDKLLPEPGPGSNPRSLNSDLFLTVSDLENMKKRKRPAPKFALIAGEFAAAELVGAAGGAVLALAGNAMDQNGGEWSGVAGAVIGGAVGYTFGTALGATWVGSSGDQDGSFSGALQGSVVGGLAAIGVAIGISNSSHGRGGALYAVPLILPAVGAVIGFNEGSVLRIRIQ